MKKGAYAKGFYLCVFIAFLFAGSSFLKAVTGDSKEGCAYARASGQGESAELVVQNPHAGAILSLAVSKDNKLVASAGDDGMVKLWDVETGRLLRDLMHNQYYVHSVAFSPGGETLATGSGDHTVRLWDVKSGRELKVLEGHVHAVRALAFSPDGRFLASGSRAYAKDPATALFVVWDASSGKAIQSVNGDGEVIELLFSRDGGALVVAKPGSIALWDWRKRRQIVELEEGPDKIFSLALSPAGDRLAASSWRGIKLWDPGTGRLLKEASFGRGFQMLAMAFRADGKSLMLVRPDGIQYTGLDLNLSAEPRVKGFKISGRAVLSWDLGLCAFTGGGGSVGFLRPSTGLLNKAKVPEKSLAVRAVGFSRDGKSVFAAMDDGTTRRWNLGRGMPEALYHGHEEAIHSLGVSPRDGSVVTAGYDGKILFWNPELETRVHEIIIQHPGGTDPFREQREESRRELRSYPGASYRPKAPRHLGFAGGPTKTSLVTSCLSPDGTRLAYGGYEYFVVLYDVIKKKGEELAISPDSKLSAVNALAFDKHGNTLAVGDENGGVVLWDIPRSREIWRFNAHNSVTALCFSPLDPRLLVTAGGERLIKVWDSDSGRLLKTLQGHESPVLTVSFSPKGKTLASGGADGVINVWDITRGQRLKTAKAHAVAVNALAYASDGTMLVSGGEDSTLKFWNPVNLQELASALSIDERNWLAFDRSGFFDGTHQAWQLCPFRFASEPMKLYEPEQFFAMFFQPGLLADVTRERRPMREILERQRDRRANLDIGAYRNSKQPEVRIVGPRDGASVSERVVKVTVEAEDAGSGLQDLRIFRNRSLVHFQHGALRPDPTGRVYRLTVPIRVIAGRNEITAYAFNGDNVKSKDARISITGGANLKRQGKAYILSIGINEYANQAYNLRYAVADTKTFTEKVGRSLKALGYQVESATLLNQDGTAQWIRTALDRLSGRSTAATGKSQGPRLPPRPAEPEDLVIVHFSGHGTAQGDRYYLIPHDLGYSGERDKIDEAGRNQVLSKSLSDRDLESAFEGIDSERIMLIIDACQSGQALEAEERRRGPMNSRGLAQLAYEKGIYILAAAQSREAALEFTKLGHGLLTYVLIELGLEQFEADRSPRDGKLTAEEWLDHASLRVPVEFQKAIEDRFEKTGKSVGYEEVTVTGQAPRAYFRRERIGEPWVVKQGKSAPPPREGQKKAPAIPPPRGGLKIR